jgi:chromosome segregation protein
MRLKKLKLAGFKSFVDPTVLELRSQLVGVVGPNGCGKSNIIDAVRWVMGESSAKNLRGESMSDVIFNGSSSRKPVGQATIELVFDNADGGIGGEYAQYSEISVRRQATRDGQSAYFLNGTRCRRKDITDIFLGTGLGPRSYAIIEQGMITRVIEARPEDLRAFLEEAAGVSLYRKRRQETETRMRHTRENLARLDDLRQELDKQLDRLKRQSESAIRYKQYQEEQDVLDAELSALRWSVLNDQLEEKNGRIRVLAVSLEEKLAERASLDLELEKLRLVHTEKTDAWKSEQAQYYDVGTQIARLEQTLQHHRDREENLKADFQQTEQNYHQICSQIEQDEIRLDALKQELLNVAPDFEKIEVNAAHTEEVRLKAEEAMKVWSQGFESFQQEANRSQQSAEVEKARIEQLEKQSREAKMQLDRLLKEQSEMDVNRLEQQLLALEQEMQNFDQEADVLQAQLNDLTRELNQDREILSQETAKLDELRGKLQSAKGRQVSLEALQQAALGKTNNAVKGWLESHGLLDYPRLAQSMVVEAGFERAVETVLGAALEAICMPGIDAVSGWINELETGNVIVLDSEISQSASFLPGEEGRGLSRLSAKIKTDYPIQSWVQSVYVAEELSEALAQRKNLNADESIVTKEGIWLGPHWIKVYRGNDGHAGVLAREGELKELAALIAAFDEQLGTTEDAVFTTREKIKSLETQRDTLHQSQQQQACFSKEQASKVSAERAKQEHVRNRLARLQNEMAEQNQRLSLAEEETALARITLQSALDEMEICTKKRSILQTERDSLRQLLQQATHEARTAKEEIHAITLKQQTLVTQRQAIEEGLIRLSNQQQTNQERRANLQTQIVGLEAPQRELQETLEELLVKRIKAEETLNQARAALDELEQNLRSFEKRRNGLETEAGDIRQQLEQCRMDWQALQVRGQTVQEKLAQIGKTIEQILETMPKEAEETIWAERLEQIIKKIERLGAINLAAIEEYQSESERKTYLDSQHKDLTEALETLENAIRKIDKETRARFKETFEKVNAEFQKLFPKLFGGGQATLELIGEDLLEAGVTVMARPPGKRNSSIHLLSGGEKALTAVAMVFAIFQLNPAPFCLLDEVDAPLDDANVGRFCEMVKQMSSTVQFVVVTHNKLAMEIAHHLVGVTMKEPGVSRLVSVDVEEAAALVAG